MLKVNYNFKQTFRLSIQIKYIYEKFKKLLKRDLTQINGGNAPQCPKGYKPCLKIDETTENPKWTCIPSNLSCNP